MNIYIACGLTHVPKEQFDEYVAFIHHLAGVLGTTAFKSQAEIAALIAKEPASAVLSLLQPLCNPPRAESRCWA